MISLTQWIQSRVGLPHLTVHRKATYIVQHGNCPTCRHDFLDIRPLSESDDESSDGGEYIPYEHDEDDLDNSDEDGFLGTDGYSDPPAYDMDDMTDGDEWWEEGETDADVLIEEDDVLEWILTQGEFSMEDNGGVMGMSSGRGPYSRQA